MIGFSTKNLLQRRGQTFIEYSILLGLVAAFILAMSPFLRRGAQGMVKVMSDQIGRQNEGDQRGGKMGHMERADIDVDLTKDTRVVDRQGAVSYEYQMDETTTRSEQYSNLGYSK